MKNFALTTAAFLMASTAAIAQIETRTVTFENEGTTLSGTLYLPEGHDGAPLPTVVVTGAWTSVEEQMPTVYAEQMVERGFAAFTFDFRGWGKSGDLPQNAPLRGKPRSQNIRYPRGVRLCCDPDRFKIRAMARNELLAARPREISSLSINLSAIRDLLRSGDRMPPVAERWGKTDEDARSKQRPIELIDSPRCQRSHISDFCLSV